MQQSTQGISQKIARRYATALYSLAKEQNKAEAVYQDMTLISRVFSESRELRVLMKSPVVRDWKKQRIASRLFQGKTDPLVQDYIGIVIRKHRGALLDPIARAYQKVFHEKSGIADVGVITAVPMDQHLRVKVVEAVKNLGKEQMILTEVVDPRIIGGFVLRMGDMQYDASVKGKLQKIKKHLNLHA